VNVIITPETPAMSTGSAWLMPVDPAGMMVARYCPS
jgi:hypothetical protein